MTQSSEPFPQAALVSGRYERIERRLRPFADRPDYLVTAFVPPAAAAPPGGFPVVTVLDGDYAVGAVSEYLRISAVTGETPPVVVLGVGYGANEPYATFFERRFWDFAPRRARDLSGLDAMYGGVPVGGADDFLTFLCGPVRDLPGVPVNEDRHVLAGFSLGALFALTALVQKPRSFQGWLLGSPSLWYDDGRWLDAALALNADHFAPGTRLFISVGEAEQLDPRPEYQHARMVSNYARLAGRLTMLRGANLRVDAEIMPGETHISAMPIALTRGLRRLLAD